MLYVVLFFLMVSLLLYVLLAGADFGAGILELFSSKKNQNKTKKIVYRVIGPVWEANHIWIIILIVILWVGFPKFYNILMVYLHVPLTLVLLGITLRGVSFVFRHYDAFKDKSQIVYDWMFRVSSLVTPICLGMTFGGMVSGKITTATVAQTSFLDTFIWPWFNGFSFLVGLFFAALCSFLAAVLLIGESKPNERQFYVKKARVANITVIAIGFVVLCYGFFSKISFITDFMSNPLAVALVLLSSILIFPLSLSIKKAQKVWSRFLCGIQVVLILFAALFTHFPYFLITAESKISIVQTASSTEVIKILGISLIIGGAFILPGLFHLFKSFKMIKVLEKDN